MTKAAKERHPVRNYCIQCSFVLGVVLGLLHPVT
jgi:hypothetical protein